MKIATFNANGVRARLPVIKKWLALERPHILCLQETKVQDRDFPLEPFSELGYRTAFWGQKAYNGVATLTRQEPEDVFLGLGDGDLQEEPRIVTVTVGQIHVVNTYVPQGAAPDSPKFIYKLSWLKRLKTFFETRFNIEDPLVWVGDFNVAPESKDVYDPEKLRGHVGFHPEEHKALTALANWGFVDILRKHNTAGGVYSFWDYRLPKALERGLGWRIDHIWASPTMAARSTAAWVDIDPRGWEKPSDHTFVVADFQTDGLQG